MIAEVQADRDGHGITAENHESFPIYQSTKQIQIRGTGFRDGMKASAHVNGWLVDAACFLLGKS